MKFCPHCGKELSVQSSFCPHCGETLVGKTNDLNIFREFWIILTGSCLLAILSFMDWVTIATDDIGLNPYSLWRELSGINNHGSSPSQEFLIVQFSTIIILFLLLLSFILLLAYLINHSHTKLEYALVGFQVNAFVMIIFIILISLSNNILSKDLFGYTFKLFHLENSPYIMLVISVFEIITICSSKRKDT